MQRVRRKFQGTTRREVQMTSTTGKQKQPRLEVVKGCKKVGTRGAVYNFVGDMMTEHGNSHNVIEISRENRLLCVQQYRTLSVIRVTVVARRGCANRKKHVFFPPLTPYRRIGLNVTMQDL